MIAAYGTTLRIPQCLEGFANEWILAKPKDSSSPIDLFSMPDPHNDNHHPFPVDTVYHAIIADANPKMVRLRFELLAAWRKRIFAERGNFLGDAPLELLVEGPELP